MDQLAATIAREFDDLHRRMREAIDGLDQAALDWSPMAGTNSMDVLVTHTLGSSVEWLHAAAARPMPTARDREAEFRVAGQGAPTLIAEIDRVRAIIPELLQAAKAGDFFATRVRPRDGQTATALWMALHALEHTSEHVGHLEMTRQLLPEVTKPA